MKGREFKLVAWNDDFIAALGRYLSGLAAADLAGLTLVFPHQRPKRYLLKHLAGEEGLGKPLILPRMLSFSEFAAELGLWLEPAARIIEPLDQACLLRQAVLELGERESSGLFELAYDLGRFFPWGLRLAGLCEELYRQNLPAQDLANLEDAVLPPAAALLANLRNVSQAYERLLVAQELSTAGRELARLAASPELAGERLRGRALFCGFYALAGSEEVIVKNLWHLGRAEVVLHSDPKLMQGQPAHSCRGHQKWLEDWKAGLVWLEPGRESGSARPEIKFYNGYDLHSQLKSLQEELENADLAQSAVVLPDTGMLMPALHHLPNHDVNISMGYPIARSALFALIEAVFELQESRCEAGYHWRALVALLRHPYLLRLAPEDGKSLRVLYHELENRLRRGGRYVPRESLVADAALLEALGSPQAQGLFEEVFAVCLDGFSGLNCLLDLAQALDRLVGLLIDERYRGRLFESFVIDAECLFRLKTVLLPKLTGALSARETSPKTTLFGILRQLAELERVPFEAEPLGGLQVLGWLETRLLSFKNLYILDATENMLPGPQGQDPLLPDSLRGLIGLPDAFTRDEVASHNFFRLVSGCERASMYYQTGQGSGILEEKNEPSRFLEQLIWAWETKQGRLRQPGDSLVRDIALPVRPLPKPGSGTENSPEISLALRKMLESKYVSATLLDCYLACPQRFFLKYAAKLQPMDEVREDGDSLALGNLTHKVLEEYFKPMAGRRLTAEDLDVEALLAAYSEQFRPGKFPGPISREAALLLESAGLERLRRYAKNFQPTTMLEFERAVNCKLNICGVNIQLFGKIDRVDRRESGLMLLDYKTGRPKMPQKGFFSDADLLTRLRSSDRDNDLELFCELGERLQSLQLPLYAFMKRQQDGIWPANAAYIELYQKGQECALIDTDSEEDIELLESAVPTFLEYMLRRMLDAPVFEALSGKQCAWCEFAPACEFREYVET